MIDYTEEYMEDIWGEPFICDDCGGKFHRIRDESPITYDTCMYCEYKDYPKILGELRAKRFAI